MEPLKTNSLLWKFCLCQNESKASDVHFPCTVSVTSLKTNGGVILIVADIFCLEGLPLWKRNTYKGLLRGFHQLLKCYFWYKSSGLQAATYQMLTCNVSLSLFLPPFLPLFSPKASLPLLFSHSFSLSFPSLLHFLLLLSLCLQPS